MSRTSIKVGLHGSPDSLGRVSHDLIYTNLEGQHRAQSFFADPTSTVARLRHNMADSFWFYRRRARLMRQAQQKEEINHGT